MESRIAFWGNVLDAAYKELAIDPDKQRIKDQYCVAPYAWDEYLDGRRSADVIRRTLKKGAGALSAEQLYTLAIGEGLNTWLVKKTVIGHDDPEALVNGFGRLGLDHFADEVEALKSEGYLPNSFNEYTPITAQNEKGETVHSAVFSNIEAALTAFCALANKRATMAIAYGTRLGYGTIHEDSKMFWAYVFFQSPVEGRRLLRQQGSWDHSTIKFNTTAQDPPDIPSKALRRLASWQYILLKKVFNFNHYESHSIGGDTLFFYKVYVSAKYNKRHK